MLRQKRNLEAAMSKEELCIKVAHVIASINRELDSEKILERAKLAVRRLRKV